MRSGAESDATDAVLLANIIRTEPDAHRPLAADTDLAQTIRVPARAQQDAVSARQQMGNQIRDLLKDFYPTALVALAELPAGGLARAASSPASLAWEPDRWPGTGRDRLRPRPFRRYPRVESLRRFCADRPRQRLAPVAFIAIGVLTQVHSRVSP